MNKKILFGTLLAMFCIVFAGTFTACTEQENEPTAAANVNFSLRKAQATQASGDGQGTNLLVYAVYDKAGNLLENLGGKNENAFATALTEKVSLKLTKGQTYTVVFWAQNSACQAYDYSNLKAIKIDYTKVTQNSEAFDAFFGSKTFTITEDFGETVELHRPFAQLNFAIPAEDLEFAKKEGLEISASRVEVSEVATILNAMTGDVDGETAVAFTAATLPTTTLTIKVDGKDSTYAHLSMNYLLANALPATASTTADVKFVFTTNKDAITVESSATPLQRNWRTNIISSIRNMADFDVVIDPDFDGDNVGGDAFPFELNETYYSTFAAALAAAVDGDVINIAAGTYELPTQITLKDGAKGTITFAGTGEATVLLDGTTAENGSGMTIHMKDLTYKTANDGYTGGIIHAAAINFDNCTIIGQYYAQSSAPHTFTKCTIEQSNGYLYTYGANCTFESCTFDSSEGKALQVYAESYDVESTITINNCTFTAAKVGNTYDGKPVTAIDINSIRGNKFNVNINNTTATGYGTGLYSGSDLWNIKGGAENVIVTIDGAQYIAEGVTLKDGVMSAGEGCDLATIANLNDANVTTLLFTADITGAATVANAYGENTGILQSNNSVIDGQGHTLTVNSAKYAITTSGGTIKNMTIVGGGRAIAIIGAKVPVYVENVHISNSTYTVWGGDSNYGGLVITNSTLNGWTSWGGQVGEVSCTNCAFGSNGSYAYCRPYGVTTLTDCTFSEGYELDATHSSSIKLINCKVGNTALTAENLTTLLGADAANAIVE